MLIPLGGTARRWATVAPWTSVYGLARTLLALGTAGTLAANAPSTLFRPALGLPPAPYCIGPTQVSLFCLVPSELLWLANWLALAILLLVASGWRPRLTAIPHWWVAFSLQVTATVLDGGDQVTAVLTLLLLPVALTDPRRWHWGAPPESDPSARGLSARLVARSALLAVRLQVAAIYLHSSVSKLGVAEWADGTAMHYWLLDPAFGAPFWSRDLALAVLSTGLGVTVLTWGTIVFEACLALALVLDRRFWGVLLVLGIAFHTAIAVLMGLVSFALAMIAALVLYLRPFDRPFAFPVRLRRVARIATRPAHAREGLPA